MSDTEERRKLVEAVEKTSAAWHKVYAARIKAAAAWDKAKKDLDAYDAAHGKEAGE